jgi:predicted amidohydrolase
VLDYAQWMTLTRAAENRVFWIIANRTGTETLGAKTMTFTGCSQFVAPGGKLLYRAGIDTEELHIIEIDPAAADDKNITPRNHLITDRRTDLYPT